MATEFQELKIVVNLADQASANMVRLRTHVENLGHSANVAHFLRQTERHDTIRKHMIEGSRINLAGASRIAGVSRLFAVGGPFSIALAAIGAVVLGASKAVNHAVEMLEEIHKLSNLTGVGPAQLKEWGDAIERVGGDRGAIAQMAVNMRENAGDLSRNTSSLVNAIRFQGRNDPVGTEQLIERLRRYAKEDLPAMQLEIMRQIEFQGMKREGESDAEAQERKQRAMIMFRQDPALQRAYEEGKLRKTTKAEEEEFRKRIENMKRFYKASRIIGEEFQKLKEKFMAMVVKKDLPIFKTLKWVLETSVWLADNAAWAVEKSNELDRRVWNWLTGRGFVNIPIPGSSSSGGGATTPQKFTDAFIEDKNLTDEQIQQLERAQNEVKRLADWASLPENQAALGLLKTQMSGLPKGYSHDGGVAKFHNAPRGGAAGESNPEQLPPGSVQPGGGSAAESRKNTRDLSVRAQQALDELGTPAPGTPLPQKRPPQASINLNTAGPLAALGASYVGNRVYSYDDPRITNPIAKQTIEENKGGSLFGFAYPHIDKPEAYYEPGSGQEISTMAHEFEHVGRTAVRIGAAAGKSLEPNVFKRYEAYVEPSFSESRGSKEELQQRYQEMVTSSQLKRTGAISLNEQIESSNEAQTYLSRRGGAPQGEYEEAQRHIEAQREYARLMLASPFWSRSSGDLKEEDASAKARPSILDLIDAPSPGGMPMGEPIEGMANRARGADSGIDGLDRSELSRTDPNRVNTNGGLEVDVVAPHGTSVEASGDGVFAKPTVDRTMPLDEATN